MSFQHQARKRFGQNFLIDQQIIQQIVSAIGPKESDNLIEIGPGMAAITEHLVQHCPAMTLVELDRDLVDYLKEKFFDQPQLSIYSGDALQTDFSQFYDPKTPFGRKPALQYFNTPTVPPSQFKRPDQRYAFYASKRGG